VEAWSKNASAIVDLESAAPYRSAAEPDLSSDRWYVLYGRSSHEKVVENSLRGRGYNVFSPSYRTKRKRLDRIAQIDVALFPGCVFCQFDPSERLPILMTPGGGRRGRPRESARSSRSH
jgi:hypothetical protein